MKKKYIWFIIIVIIVLLLSFLGYKYFTKSHFEIVYSISTQSAANKTINMDITSRKAISEVILPNGVTKNYNGDKDITIKYPITANGEYKFTVIDEDGNEEVKIVTVSNYSDSKTTTTKTTTTKKVSATTTTTTKANTSSTSKSSDNSLKILFVLDDKITLEDDQNDYYVYTADEVTNPKIKYELSSSKARSSVNLKDLVLGDNLYSIKVTAENGTARTYNIHIIKYNLNILFSNIKTEVTNEDINTKILVNLSADAPLDIVKTIDYAFSDNDTITPLVFSSYDIVNGIDIINSNYIWAKVTCKDNKVYYKVSSLYNIDKIKPTLTHLNALNNIIINGNDNDIKIETMNDLGTQKFGISNGTYLTDVYLKSDTITFTLSGSDNYTNITNLEYSYATKATSDITNENGSWSEWSKTNTVSLNAINRYDNSLYIAFRVKDEAGNISVVDSTSVYYIPSLIDYALTNNYYFNISDTLSISDTCNKNTINYYKYNALNVKESNTIYKFCVDTCPTGTTLANDICTED